MDSRAQHTPGLKHLVTAVSKITSRLDIDSVMAQLVEALTDDLEGVYASVWLVDKGDKCTNCEARYECLDKDSCLHLRAWAGRENSNPALRERIPLGVMKIGSIALSKSPYLANDVPDDPMVTDLEWFHAAGISSFAGFPLLKGDELLGVMAYFGDRPLTAELGDMLLCLARQSAMAVIDAEAHKRVRESEERYRALIDGAIDAVFILGSGGRILAASRSATRQFGYTGEELTSMSIEDLDPDSFEVLKVSYPSLLAGETVTYNGKFTAKSGKAMPVEVKAGATIYTGDTAIQAFVRDMTDRVVMEKHKADVTSMLTHDLKGPISIILGYSEVIHEQYQDQLPEFVKEGIDAINRGGAKLLSLVEDYLSLSKMESGVLKMHKYPTDICQLIDRAMDMVTLKAEQKELFVTINCRDGFPDLEVDPKYMERAVSNLLINAVNYTPRGGSIKVNCWKEDDTGNAIMEISDTGVGIPADELPMVFEKYYRVKDSAVKGTGLGLAIVKSVVEGHGGTVEVESQVGSGTTFRITVPIF
jgi:PAS domain S-box-containing protein